MSDHGADARTRLLDGIEADMADAELALARLDAGRYARCEVCEGVIDGERLAAAPVTRRCGACAAEV